MKKAIWPVVKKINWKENILPNVISTGLEWYRKLCEDVWNHFSVTKAHGWWPRLPLLWNNFLLPTTLNNYSVLNITLATIPFNESNQLLQKSLGAKTAHSSSKRRLILLLNFENFKNLFKYWKQKIHQIHVSQSRKMVHILLNAWTPQIRLFLDLQSRKSAVYPIKVFYQLMVCMLLAFSPKRNLTDANCILGLLQKIRNYGKKNSKNKSHAHMNSSAFLTMVLQKWKLK